MNINDIEDDLVKLLDELEPLIGKDHEVEELVVKHGEYGVALENLCSIIEESNTKIKLSLFLKIIDLSKQMEFDEKVIEYFRENLKVKND